MTDTNRYIIESSPVGQGGFGKVHPGQDTILERKIAVKQLDPVLAAASEEDKRRFRREATTLAKMSHPNIPAIYDVVFKDGHFEFIFQFVEGKTVRKLLEEEEVLQLAECRAWFDQLASALQHAHDNGIIHRDIKPENMIVTPDRRHCYLVDFGIALSKSEVERLTGSDNWIGTPGYMSPEQQQGADLDTSDDVFVLGICLYEALSGHQVQLGDYRPLNSVNELIPPAIDDLVRRCIADKPRRLKTATEFRNLLRSALNGHRTLSEVLAAGQLHEVIDVIDSMTPVQFSEMRAGQRLLILQRCHDLVAEDDRRLIPARNEFLSVLTGLGIFLDKEDYAKVVAPAVRHGFGTKDIDGKMNFGVPMIRQSLTDAAVRVGTENHRVMVKSLLGWLKDVDLDAQKSGLYHVLRLLLNALMANQDCNDEDAQELAKILQRVNNLQRSKVHDMENLFPV